jgi:hypothetical protein
MLRGNLYLYKRHNSLFNILSFDATVWLQTASPNKPEILNRNNTMGEFRIPWWTVLRYNIMVYDAVYFSKWLNVASFFRVLHHRSAKSPVLSRTFDYARTVIIVTDRTGRGISQTVHCLTYVTEAHAQSGQSKWAVWWTKWHRNVFISEYFGFPLSV